MAFVDTPLTVASALQSWRWDIPTITVVAVISVGYWRASTIRSDGDQVVTNTRRFTFLLVGSFSWLFAAVSFIGVYADTLFWVRALQVVLLLFVVPFGFALGKPLTVLRNALDSRRREKFDAAIHSRLARILTYPATTSIIMLATPWLLYLTNWYVAVLQNNVVDQFTRLLLVLIGFGYFYSRLQADPVPRKFSQLISLVITAVEVIGDGVLGIVIWLGPQIAPAYYGMHERTWGPDWETDQIIGAGILWILGDVIGIPFLLALMRAFNLDDRASAAEIDAQLDAAEALAADAAAAESSANPHEPPVPPQTKALWWQNDPELKDRFRHR